MGKSEHAVYEPISSNADRYDELFAEYTALHDHFGRGGNDVMRRLKRIRREVVAGGGAL
jgi:L-ribulokinase